MKKLLLVSVMAGATILAATACGGSSSAASATSSVDSTKQKIIEWDAQYGSIITTLSDDMTSIGQDGTTMNVSGMERDCDSFDVDVTKALGLPAIPDSQTASDFGSALTYFQTAAQSCSNGARNLDSTEISAAATAMRNGNTKLDAATQDLKAFQ